MEQSANQITVSISKSKVVDLLVRPIALVAFGLLLMLRPNKFSGVENSYKTFQLVMGGLCILGSLSLGYLSLKNLRTGKPGLIIDPSGLQKKFRRTYAGHIAWIDINRIYILKIFWRKVIFLFVNNPGVYIDRQKNWFNKVTMFLDYKVVGSPLTVTTDGLNITFEELYQLINKYFLLFKK
jgi:hypothetical protein